MCVCLCIVYVCVRVCVCVCLGWCIFRGDGVWERDFTGDKGNFWEGLERSEAKLTEAKQSRAE